MSKAQFSAIIDGVTKKKDSTLSIRLGTQELGKDDTAQIFDFCNRQIWVALADVEIQPDDLNIPESLSEFKTDKTPSQRLRGVLYRFWEKNKKNKMDWDTFYKQQVERIIEYIKDKME